MLLDSGNFSDNPTSVGDLRTRALLEAMDKLGYAVANVGERDLALGFEEFRKKTAGIGIRFVSSNIVRQDTREPVFEPHAIVDVPRGAGKPPLRVGVLGVTRYSPVWLKQGPDGSSLVLAQPLDMVRKYLPEIRPRCDVAVLLAALSNMDAHRIAKEVPGLDFVFGSYGGIVSTVEEIEGGTRIVYTGNQGQRVGETRVYLGSPRQDEPLRSDSYIHHLSSRYPDDESLRAFVQEVSAKAKSASGGEPQATGSRPRAGGSGSSP